MYIVSRQHTNFEEYTHYTGFFDHLTVYSSLQRVSLRPLMLSWNLCRTHFRLQVMKYDPLKFQLKKPRKITNKRQHFRTVCLCVTTFYYLISILFPFLIYISALSGPWIDRQTNFTFCGDIYNYKKFVEPRVAPGQK